MFVCTKKGIHNNAGGYFWFSPKCRRWHTETAGYNVRIIDE